MSTPQRTSTPNGGADDCAQVARENMLHGENFPDGDGIRHGFFSRRGGVSGSIYGSLNCGPGSRDNADSVRENRGRVLQALGVPAAGLVTVYQEHGPKVVTVRPGNVPDRSVRADGLVTDAPGFVLGILTADCAPILFADTDAQVVGACHAGWRGAFEGVAEATVTAMQSLGAKPERVSACIGPCIGAESYEVGPEFFQRFQDQDPGNAVYFRPSQRAGHHYFDLGGYLLRRLDALGLANTAMVGRDTFREEDMYFSYRRSCHRGEPDYGRMVSAICLTTSDDNADR